MKIGMIYGRFCSGGQNAFDVAGLYRVKGLTGSESFFFNTARGLASIGHDVQVFADVTEEFPDGTPVLDGANVFKLDSAGKWSSDICLAWNEPDLCRFVPQTNLKIVMQQLNDFRFCGPDYDRFVDVYAFPSEAHRKFMVEDSKLDITKTVVLPNSINLEFYEGEEKRRPHSVAYCSSPDRGLHWLLEYWPAIRKRVPDAQLRIYYRVQSWLDGSRPLWFDHGMQCWWEGGFRARYAEECFKRLGRNGENGIILVGPTPNMEMARELMRTQVLAYTCDTLRWTEGFSVTTLDALAAGCVTLISDVDAIGSIYKDVAEVIPDRPVSQDPRWIDAIVRGMTDEDYQRECREKSRPFVEKQTRQIRAKQWEQLITDQLAKRAVARLQSSGFVAEASP